MMALRKTTYYTTAEACRKLGFSRQRFHVLKTRLALVPWMEGNPKRVWWTDKQVAAIDAARKAKR